jgi:UDP-N-acetylmuramate: L-alanyl-gamma-D-glutamyl-meso-diaminopimelate ligase
VVAVLNGHGIQADASPDTEVLVRRVIAEAAPGDVVLVMSNGSFGGFIPTLLAGLERRFR